VLLDGLAADHWQVFLAGNDHVWELSPAQEDPAKVLKHRVVVYGSCVLHNLLEDSRNLVREPRLRFYLAGNEEDAVQFRDGMAFLIEEESKPLLVPQEGELGFTLVLPILGQKHLVLDDLSIRAHEG